MGSMCKNGRNTQEGYDRAGLVGACGDPTSPVRSHYLLKEGYMGCLTKSILVWLWCGCPQ